LDELQLIGEVPGFALDPLQVLQVFCLLYYIF